MPAKSFRHKSFMAMALTALVILASPAVTPTSAQSAEDSVTGDVVASNPPFTDTFVFDVRSGPSGENARGQVIATEQGTPFFTGTVTCLAVAGNVALFNLQATPFGLLAFRVVDNAGTSTADTVQVTFASSSATECSTPESSYLLNSVVVSGDVVVTDASPFPTAKDQCKNGGWRAFGEAFANQGQCVAFVQRGPKPR